MRIPLSQAIKECNNFADLCITASLILQRADHVYRVLNEDHCIYIFLVDLGVFSGTYVVQESCTTSQTSYNLVAVPQSYANLTEEQIATLES
jgi:hypothetical protein